jgi:hypothetical protein
MDTPVAQPEINPNVIVANVEQTPPLVPPNRTKRSPGGHFNKN